MKNILRKYFQLWQPWQDSFENKKKVTSSAIFYGLTIGPLVGLVAGISWLLSRAWGVIAYPITSWLSKD